MFSNETKELPTFRIVTPTALISKCAVVDSAIDTHIIFVDRDGDRNQYNDSGWLSSFKSYSTFNGKRVPVDISSGVLRPIFHKYIADTLLAFDLSSNALLVTDDKPHPPFISFSSSCVSLDAMLTNIANFGVVITIGDAPHSLENDPHHSATVQRLGEHWQTMVASLRGEGQGPEADKRRELERDASVIGVLEILSGATISCSM